MGSIMDKNISQNKPENESNIMADLTPVYKNPFIEGLKEWAKIIVIALLISMPIRFFIAEPFVVNGASMDPTFSTGQFLIVDRLTYKMSQPTRGDVIVFEYPNNPSVYYIKRIVGLPGETVRIKDGVVSIENKDFPKGFTLDEPYVERSHKSYENMITTLGDSEYFVMGDNRNQSSDSRAWGSLEYKFIVGKPLLRLLPVNSLSITPGQYHDKTN